MTTEELRDHLNKTYGFENAWPASMKVSPETYANCCQEVFDWKKQMTPTASFINIAVGRVGNGIIYKSIELLLDKDML